LKEDNRENYERLVDILDRENKSFSDFVFEHVASYVRLHEPGNPQQRLDTIIRLGKSYHAPTKICGFKDCKRVAVAVGLFKPNQKEYALCSRHLAEAKENRPSWTMLNGL